jgi:hypothetical protein
MQHGDIQLRQRPARSLRQLKIQGGTPAQRTGDDFEQQRAVALVSQPVTDTRDRFAEIERDFIDQSQRINGCAAGRGPRGADFVS